ncbi:hypothetical protein glysoja_003258 [Glycine soja]|nr:hypothetical protein glysoja_003258 [Glycine soja]
MSLEDKNAGGQQFMENGDNHKGLNKYACASVLAANIVSAIFGYGNDGTTMVYQGGGGMVVALGGGGTTRVGAKREPGAFHLGNALVDAKVRQ